jgi:hypothetical protein
MRSFREILEDKAQDYENEDRDWTKQDLIELIQEQDLDDDDISEITELVLEIVEYGDFDGDDFDPDNFDWDNYDWDDDIDDIDERMSNKAKKEAAKKRRKPAFKRAMKKKLKCQKKFADKIKKTKKSGVPMVCNVKGKLVKGMNRAERRKLAKTRKKNKNKIIN